MGIPKNSPRILSLLICSGCSKPMRPDIRSLGNGELLGIDHYCDRCGYGITDSAPYSQSQPTPYKTKDALVKEKQEAAQKEADARAKREAAQKKSQPADVRKGNGEQTDDHRNAGDLV